MGWKELKAAFFVCAAIWLIGGIGVQIAIRRASGDIVTLLNLHSIFVTGFGSVTAVLGAILLGRWIWMRSSELSANRKRQLRPKTQTSQSNEEKKSPTSERWIALVRFDDDVRAAVEKLRPYGDTWVDELRRAHFALSEDKKYLASISGSSLDALTALERQPHEN